MSAQPRVISRGWDEHREAIEASYRTGGMDSVYSAIKNGCGTIPDIMTRTNLDETAVRNAVRRLQDVKRIQRKNLGGYEPATARCLLAEVWR